MRTAHTIGSVAAALAATVAFAQTPDPSTAQGAQPSNPTSASSPHQRAVTKAPQPEAPAATGSNPSDAATPAQKSSVRKKGHKAAGQADKQEMKKIPPASPES